MDWSRSIRGMGRGE